MTAPSVPVPTLEAVDIPQSDSLLTIRLIVEAVKKHGDDVGEISEDTGVSDRHVRYRLRAAWVLGFVDENRQLTRLGASLLETRRGSPEERQLLVRAVEASRVVRALFPGFFNAQEFDVDQAARLISGATGISLATAHRRARVLRSWKRQLTP